jgi:hypothetical protein
VISNILNYEYVAAHVFSGTNDLFLIRADNPFKTCLTLVSEEVKVARNVFSFPCQGTGKIQ